MIDIPLAMDSIESYRRFLQIKALPSYRFCGRTAIIPDRYASMLGLSDGGVGREAEYVPSEFLFDYQRDIARMAIERRKFSIFADCGLGKTLIYFEWARHVAKVTDGAVLIVCPLMVIEQMIAEASRFYGDELPLEHVRGSDLDGWLCNGARFGVTNFESFSRDIEPGRLSGLIIDESSMFKSHYGKWGGRIMRLGRGLQWKLCGTGTPAPNDRIEYANHAVFMDAFPSVNSFLARFFINRGQTDNRWELKPHAIQPFYRALSDWSIFLANPGTYGWTDHCGDIPPIHVHIHEVSMTADQLAAVQSVTGNLFATDAGGIGQRSKLGQIAKGRLGKESLAENKTAFIRGLVDSWPDESTIIWCIYNAEQNLVAKQFPDAAVIDGSTPHQERLRLIGEFQSGQRKVLITKPKILGFGLNLQVATRQIFSGLQDSYESYYQAVKRSNRVGSTRPLNVHIPVTDAEAPMVQNVLSKAKRVQADTEEQERIFCNARDF